MEVCQFKYKDSEYMVMPADAGMQEMKILVSPKESFGPAFTGMKRKMKVRHSLTETVVSA
jgi:ribosomal protein S6E (S10)